MNAELVKEIYEVVRQHHNGLITDWELLAKCVEIGVQIQPSETPEIDQL